MGASVNKETEPAPLIYGKQALRFYDWLKILWCIDTRFQEPSALYRREGEHSPPGSDQSVRQILGL